MANRGGGRRLSKSWGFLPAVSVAMTADGTFGTSGLSFLAPDTVLRMIGEYTIGLSGAGTNGDGVFVVFAIGVISTDAFSLGATAMPDPGQEPDYPWLYWQSHGFRYPTATGTAIGEGNDGPQATVRKSFDIRSMRKMKPRETLFGVLQYVDITGAPPMRADIGHTRVLIGSH